MQSCTTNSNINNGFRSWYSLEMLTLYTTKYFENMSAIWYFGTFRHVSTLYAYNAAYSL